MRRLRFGIIALSVVLLSARTAHCQWSTVNAGTTVPSKCEIGTVYITTTTPTLYTCNTTDTWTAAVWNGSLPAGAIIFIASGTCPATFTEVAGLNGRIVRGTVAANGNVGTTGGSDTYTPAGTNSAPALTMNSYTPAGTISALTFTGTAWSAPAVSWPAGVPTFTGTVNTLAVTAHTVVATKQGASAGNVVTTATHAITGIPGGTNAWPAGVPTLATYTPLGTINTPTLTGTPATLTGSVAAPAFTGTPATVIPAYELLIACSKN